MLFDGLTVVTNPLRLLSEPSFRAFVSPVVDEREALGEGQDLEAVIMEVCLPNIFIQHSSLCSTRLLHPCRVGYTLRVDLYMFEYTVPIRSTYLHLRYQSSELGLPGDAGVHPSNYSSVIPAHGDVCFLF